MKKTNPYLIVLSAFLLMAGCAEENTFDASFHEGGYSLLATIEGQETDQTGSRTAVGESGEVTWIDTDALGVFAAHTRNAKFVSGGTGAAVSFTGDLDSADESAEWAYYPYSADAERDGETLSFTLPSEYVYTGNSNAPMIGMKNADGSFVFKHLCGLIRFTLGGEIPQGADRFVITSVGDDAPALAGRVTVADVHADEAVLNITGEGSRSITYTLDGAAAAASGEYRHFFVPLPAGTYGKLQVSFFLKGKTEPEFTRTLSDLVVERAVMTSMPVLDWKTGEQFVLGENTLEITGALAGRVSVSPEKNTTLLYKETATDRIPAAGDIVWSRMSEHFPDGFLGKVTKVTKNPDGSYSVETGVAALSEAFEELYINETVELEPVLLGRSRAEEMKVFGFNITANRDIKIGVENDPVYLSGSIGYGFEFKATVILNKKKKIEQASFTLAQAYKMEYGLGMDGTFAGDNAPIKQPLGELQFRSIPLAYGLVQLTPEIAPHFVIKAGGEIKSEATFSSEIVTYTGVEFKNGEWRAGQNKRNKSKSESPWDFGGHLTFVGETVMGLSSDCELELYNRDDMKISLVPELDAKLSGEIKIDDTNSASLEKILNDIKLTASLGFSAKISLNASLLSPDDQLKAEFSLLEKKIWERELYLLPTFRNLLAQLKEEEAAKSFDVTITTEANREMLSKETRLFVEATNEEGEVSRRTEPVVHTGAPAEEVIEAEGEPVVPEPTPIDVTFNNLSTDTVYTARPVIESPLLKDIVPDGRIKPESLSVVLKASGSIREQLIQLYKDTNGDNWTNNENWCSDKPIDTWYGIINSTDALQINLSANNLKGHITLSDERLLNLNVSDNALTSINLSDCVNLKTLLANRNDLESINLSGCINLQGVSTWGIENLKTMNISNCTQLTSIPLFNYKTINHLDAHGCVSLSRGLDISRNTNLEYLDLSDCNELVKDGHLWYNMLGLKTLKLKNCTRLTTLHWEAGAPLETLDVSGCTNLKELGALTFDTPSSRQLKWVNLSGCTSLEKSLFFSQYPIRYLDIRGVVGPDINVDLTDNLQELKANGAVLRRLNISACTNLEHFELDGIKVKILKIANLPISSLDMLANPEEITELYIRNCPITSFDSALYPALEKLSFIETQISALDIQKCTNMTELYCGNNEKLSSLNVNGCQKLELLYCDRADLALLPLEGCTNLRILNCSENRLETLDISGCTNLRTLFCSENRLEDLDVSRCTNLSSLGCERNNITVLDVSKCTNLVSLNCRYNKIAVLDLQNNKLLKNVDCSSNQLKTLDVSMLNSLSSLDEEGNPLESLDISNTQIFSLHVGDMTSLRSLQVGSLALTKIYIVNTSVESLDISQCPNLEYLNIGNTPQLKQLVLPSEPCVKLREVYALKSTVNCEIPYWFPLDDPAFKFYYEQKYRYYYKQDEIRYESKGYGWWYPGEPGKGYHRRD